MKLKDLIKKLNVVKIIGETGVDIVDVTHDSKCVVPNGLFVCLEGQSYSGKQFIRQAEKYGCTAIVSEKELETNVVQIIVKDSRIALSIIASNFYGNIDKKLKLIAVVGTNGKTSTAHLISNILNKSGEKCGVIGTLGSFYDNKSFEQPLTTPDPLELHKIFKNMYDFGVRTVVMEVSAHAIFYKKVYGLKFEVGVFTNFSRDHLDFFSSEDEYKKIKKSFFKENKCKYIVANVDDELGKEIYDEFNNVITYSINNPADVFAIKINENKKGLSFVINLFDCVYNVNLVLNGLFNVYNAMGASTATALLGVKTEKVISALQKCPVISGRLEKVYAGNFDVYVDFAHTPDGLVKVLSAVKNNTKGGVICVFGCGGNRDTGKRREMGKVSGSLSDLTVITSDNPRYEEPMDIIFEIEKGVLEVTKNYVIIQDRTDAIEYALNVAKKDDAIIIAGKGSEKYQEILGIKLPYNDKDTVKELLKGKIL